MVCGRLAPLPSLLSFTCCSHFRTFFLWVFSSNTTSSSSSRKTAKDTAEAMIAVVLELEVSDLAWKLASEGGAASRAELILAEVVTAEVRGLKAAPVEVEIAEVAEADVAVLVGKTFSVLPSSWPLDGATLDRVLESRPASKSVSKFSSRTSSSATCLSSKLISSKFGIILGCGRSIESSSSFASYVGA